MFCIGAKRRLKSMKSELALHGHKDNSISPPRSTNAIRSTQMQSFPMRSQLFCPPYMRRCDGNTCTFCGIDISSAACRRSSGCRPVGHVSLLLARIDLIAQTMEKTQKLDFRFLGAIYKTTSVDLCCRLECCEQNSLVWPIVKHSLPFKCIRCVEYFRLHSIASSLVAPTRCYYYSKHLFTKCSYMHKTSA